MISPINDWIYMEIHPITLLKSPIIVVDPIRSPFLLVKAYDITKIVGEISSNDNVCW